MKLKLLKFAFFAFTPVVLLSLGLYFLKNGGEVKVPSLDEIPMLGDAIEKVEQEINKPPVQVFSDKEGNEIVVIGEEEETDNRKSVVNGVATFKNWKPDSPEEIKRKEEEHLKKTGRKPAKSDSNDDMDPITNALDAYDPKRIQKLMKDVQKLRDFQAERKRILDDLSKE